MLEAQRKLAESLRNEAQELLDLTDQSDKEAWFQSPCTAALIKQITADFIGIQVDWVAGGYTTESGDGTIQKNSKSIGEAQSLSEVLDKIELIKAKPIQEDNGTDHEDANG